MAAVSRNRQRQADAAVETRDPDEFASLLKQSFKPRTERAATEVENAVSTLVQQALADTSLIKDDVLDTIEEMIARIDEKLSGADERDPPLRRNSSRSRAPGAACTISSSTPRPTRC